MMKVDLERKMASYSAPTQEILKEMDNQLSIRRPGNFYVSMNQYNRLHSEASRNAKVGDADELFYKNIRVVPV